MKQLKDVLHFYIGQYAMHGENRIHICGLNVNSDKIQNILNEEFILISEIKPILRRLSSMTDEEKLELYDLIYPKSIEDEKYMRLISIDELIAGKVGVHAFTEMFKAIQYLLSKGFDLFGLCDSGQAIEKTNP